MITKYRLVLTMRTNLDFQMLLHTVCHAANAIFNNDGGGLDMPTFTFWPPQECAVYSSSGFMNTSQQK